MELISLAAGLLTSASIGFLGEDNHAWESKAHQCWYMERLNQLGLGERDDVLSGAFASAADHMGWALSQRTAAPGTTLDQSSFPVCLHHPPLAFRKCCGGTPCP